MAEKPPEMIALSEFAQAVIATDLSQENVDVLVVSPAEMINRMFQLGFITALSVALSDRALAEAIYTAVVQYNLERGTVAEAETCRMQANLTAGFRSALQLAKLQSKAGLN